MLTSEVDLSDWPTDKLIELGELLLAAYCAVGLLSPEAQRLAERVAAELDRRG